MIKDITSIPKCRVLLTAYVLTELAAALIPALTLSYSGQMLSIVSQSIFDLAPRWLHLGSSSPWAQNSRQESSHFRGVWCLCFIFSRSHSPPCKETFFLSASSMHKAILLCSHIPRNVTPRCSHIWRSSDSTPAAPSRSHWSYTCGHSFSSCNHHPTCICYRYPSPSSAFGAYQSPQRSTRWHFPRLSQLCTRLCPVDQDQ